MPEKFEVPAFNSSLNEADQAEENEYKRSQRYHESLAYAIQWHRDKPAAGVDHVIQTAVRFERFLRTGGW